MTSFNFTGPSATRSLLDWNNPQAVHPRLPAPPLVTPYHRTLTEPQSTICRTCPQELPERLLRLGYARCDVCRGAAVRRRHKKQEAA